MWKRSNLLHLDPFFATKNVEVSTQGPRATFCRETLTRGRRHKGAVLRCRHPPCTTRGRRWQITGGGTFHGEWHILLGWHIPWDWLWSKLGWRPAGEWYLWGRDTVDVLKYGLLPFSKAVKLKFLPCLQIQAWVKRVCVCVCVCVTRVQQNFFFQPGPTWTRGLSVSTSFLTHQVFTLGLSGVIRYPVSNPHLLSCHGTTNPPSVQNQSTVASNSRPYQFTNPISRTNTTVEYRARKPSFLWGRQFRCRNSSPCRLPHLYFHSHAILCANCVGNPPRQTGIICWV